MVFTVLPTIDGAPTAERTSFFFSPIFTIQRFNHASLRPFFNLGSQHTRVIPHSDTAFLITIPRTIHTTAHCHNSLYQRQVMRQIGRSHFWVFHFRPFGCTAFRYRDGSGFLGILRRRDWVTCHIFFPVLHHAPHQRCTTGERNNGRHDIRIPILSTRSQLKPIWTT